MIRPEDRWYCGTSLRTPQGGLTAYSYNIVDWDQRREYVAHGIRPDSDFEGDDQEATEQKIASGVSEAVNSPDLLVSSDLIVGLGLDFKPQPVGQEIGVDHRLAPFYPRISQCPSLAGIWTVKRPQLVEIDRMTPLVDICYYRTTEIEKNYRAFKYHSMFANQQMIWKELHLWKSLPQHPYIAKFDRAVLDEVEDRVVGFLSQYIPGGSILSNPPRIFKFKWLEQLIEVVDDLHLRYGIMHRGMHPRNILIDAEKDCIKIIDFNFSEWIGEYSNHEHDRRDDAVGAAFTIHEIITKDDSYRSNTFLYPDVDVIMDLEQWQQHRDVTLDRSVEDFRARLRVWLVQRSKSPIKHFTECPAHFSVPPAMPEGPKRKRKREAEEPEWMNIEGKEVGRRADYVKEGLYLVGWDRPEQSKLEKGKLYLVSGRPLEGELEAIED